MHCCCKTNITHTSGGTYEFSITLQPSTALDRDHVVFGRLEMDDPQAKADNEEVVRRILAVRCVCVCVLGILSLLFLPSVR